MNANVKRAVRIEARILVREAVALREYRVARNWWLGLKRRGQDRNLYWDDAIWARTRWSAYRELLDAEPIEADVAA